MPDQTISLEDAQNMTSRYRNNINTILKTTYQNQNILPYCETYDRAPFDTILGLSNCTAIRIYFGMNEEMQVRALVVGVDENDEDILPDGENDAVIIEYGRPCPDICPSVLL